MRLRAPILGLLAAGLLGAPPTAGADVERLRIRPAVGGKLDTFSFKREEDGPLDGFEDERLYLIGPDGTRCRGETDNVAVGDYGGLVTYLMAPNAPVDSYRGRNRYRFGPHHADTGKALKRWCRGTYRVVIEYAPSDTDEAEVVALGSFRVR